jgi:hypothetical protein
MERNSRLSRLHRLRHERKLQGGPAEILPVQEAIVAELEQAGSAGERANAHNYLSVLLLHLGRGREAETAARTALTHYEQVHPQSDETLGCYHCVLSRALSLQGRFLEAVAAAERGYQHYAVFHGPSDDFLTARGDDLAALRRGEQPVPLDWSGRFS